MHKRQRSSTEALAFLGTTIPEVFHKCVHVVRSIALVVDFYVRPGTREGPKQHSTGTLFVNSRKVAESHSMQAHLWEASHLPFPDPSFDQELPADLKAAIRLCVTQGACTEVWREAQKMLALRQVERDLHAYGRAISECMAGASTRIAGHMNLAFMACCVDAIYWPDYCTVVLNVGSRATPL